MLITRPSLKAGYLVIIILLLYFALTYLAKHFLRQSGDFTSEVRHFVML